MLIDMNKLLTAKRVQILNMLVEGSLMRVTSAWRTADRRTAFCMTRTRHERTTDDENCPHAK